MVGFLAIRVTDAAKPAAIIAVNSLFIGTKLQNIPILKAINF
jgi:hypothetical protein